MILTVSSVPAQTSTVSSGEVLWAFASGGFMYRLDPATGAVLETIGGVHHQYGSTGLAARRARLYFLDAVGASLPSTSRLVEIAPADASHRVIGSLGLKAYTIPSIEANPADDKIYAIVQQKLCTLDPTTGVATIVTPLKGGVFGGFTDFFVGLAFDRVGNAYVTGINGPRLYSLDVQTGQATLLANLGIGPGLFYDLAFRSDGKLWGDFVDGGFSAPQNSGLYEIDVIALAATLKQHLQFAYFGIAFVPAPEITSYCTSRTNSQGCMPSVQAHGIPCIGASKGFEIQATNLINQVPGQLLYSVRGRDQRPFHGGTLCIAAPVQRFPLQGTGGTASGGSHDCSGNLAIDVNTFAWFGGGNPLLRVPGTTVDVQWLSRDPGFAPPFDVSLTSALEFVVGP